MVIFKRIRSEQTYIIAAISGLGLSHHLFPTLTESKCFYAALHVMNYFPPYNPSYHRRNLAILSLLYRYFHGKYSHEIHYFVPPIQTFISTYAKYAGSNHLHSLRIPFTRRKFDVDDFFSRTASLWKRILRESFSDHYNSNLFMSRFIRYFSYTYKHLSLSS